jgi:predicted RNA-binding protein
MSGDHREEKLVTRDSLEEKQVLEGQRLSEVGGLENNQVKRSQVKP